MTSPAASTVSEGPSFSSEETTPSGARLTSLDGLRGVAALAVLGFHISALSPLVATYMIDKGPAPAPFTALWWAVASPLRLLTAGDEAVFVFFVLSGVVLTLPAIRQQHFDWLGFMSARVLRLFLPVAASLLLAAAITRVWPRSTDPTLSSWLAPPYNPVSVSPGQLLSNLDLIFSDMTVNGPTWTIRWEMLFSLLLPIMLGLCIAIGRRWQFGLIANAGTIVVGLEFGVSSLVFLPIFAIGILIAMRLERMSAGYAAGVAARPRRSQLLVALSVLLALVLLASTVVIRPYVDPSGVLAVASRVATVLGAGLLVAIVAVVRPAQGWLSRAPLQWLGKISFSLYLVHQPILATFGFALGGSNWISAAILGTLTAFGAAYLFWKFVESPCHRFARRCGLRVSERVHSP
jgi:peptidoglycan/LPS O-acetylase OafA/YrhL